MMGTNGRMLADKLEAAVVAGEVPYQANRRALRNFGILGNVRTGVEESEVVVSGISDFVDALEDLRDAAEDVARRAIATVR